MMFRTIMSLSLFNPANYHFLTLNFFFWSSAINALAAFLGGAVVLWRNPKDRRNRSFAAFALCVFLWASAYCIWQASLTEDVALFWTRGLMAGVIFATLALLNFTVEILELPRARYQRTIRGFFLLFTFYFISNLTPFFVSHVEQEMFFPFWPKPGILYHFYLVTWLGCFMYACWLLYRGYRVAVGHTRKQRQLLMWGFFIAVVSGSTNYLLWYGIHIAPYANVLASFYVVLIAYAIVKYGLFRTSIGVAAHTIVEIMGDALFVVERDMKIVAANRAAGGILGVDYSALSAARIDEYLPCAEKLMRDAKESGETFKSNVVGADIYLVSAAARHIPVSISLSAVPRTDSGFVFVCHDIRASEDRVKTISRQRDEMERLNGELKAAQDGFLHALEVVQAEKMAAEFERRKLEAVIGSIADGVFVVDREGRIVMANSVALRLAGSPERVEGEDFDDVFVFKDEDGRTGLGGFVRTSMEEGGVVSAGQKAVLCGLRGVITPIEAKCAPLVGAVGAVGAVVVFRDVTKERESSQMKLEFVSVAVHQLKTPLTSVRWALESVLDGDALRLSKEQFEYLHRATKSTVRMIRLVNELLNVSRLERGVLALNPQPTDITALCTEAFQEILPLAEAGGKTFVNEAKDTGTVNVDPQLIYQVILNLLSNAVKYTAAGGHIKLGAERRTDDIMIFVKDDGIGIPKKQQSMVFKKFFRAENAVRSDIEGNGLGIFIARALVLASGGKVWFDSEEGRGSAFYFTLPIAGSVRKEGDKGFVLSK